MKKPRFATVWLDGCSGCHMSFLDMDERLIELAKKVEVVHTPLIDLKEFPPDVDIALVEGAISSDEDLHKAKLIRERTKILVSLGDCAITANVPSMRNFFPVSEVMTRGYVDNTEVRPGVPKNVPVLLPKAVPLHEVVPVDVFVPGCPPPADAICFVLNELLEGRTPEIGALTRFGR